MHFPHSRTVVLALLCTLFGAARVTLAVTPEETPPNALPSVAAPDDSEIKTWRPPVRLPAMRPTQSTPAELEQAILLELIKLEEETKNEAESKAKAAAGLKEFEDRARALNEQQTAQEKADILHADLQAKARAVAEALKSAKPLPPAVIPAKKNWPLPVLLEEQAWSKPEILRLYQNPYDESDIRSVYRLCLEEAVQGNPRAMLILAYAYGRWGSKINSSFTLLHPPMQHSSFWKGWATLLTSPTWVSLRLGDLSLDLNEKISCYKAASEQGSAEATYKLAKLVDRPELLVRAALGGYPEACAIVASNLAEGTDIFPASPPLAASYWWNGALAGDVRSMLACSEHFLQGQNGFPKDERQAYIFALMAFETAQAKQNAQDIEASLLETTERHLHKLTAALRLDDYATWSLRQNLEIFKAAPQEERLDKLDKLRSMRQSALLALQDALYVVSDVLASCPPEATEPQILAKIEQALSSSGMETMPHSQAAQATEGQRGSLYFAYLGLIAFILTLVLYCFLRLHVYARIVRLVSVNSRSEA